MNKKANDDVRTYDSRILSGARSLPPPFLLLTLLFSLLLAPVCAWAAASSEGEILEAPVIIDGKTLFRVRGVTAFPAERRAKEIASRILSMAADKNFSVDSIKIAETSQGTSITAGDTTILTVFDVDAEMEQVARKTLSDVFSRHIAEAIESYRESRKPQNLIRNTVFLAAATIALGLFLWVGRVILIRVDRLLDARIKTRLEGLEEQSFRILSANHLWTLLRGVRNLLWIVSVLAVIIVYLNFVLQLFPWTRHIGNRFLSLLLDPLEQMGKGVLEFIPNLFFWSFFLLLRVIFSRRFDSSLMGSPMAQSIWTALTRNGHFQPTGLSGCWSLSFRW